MKLFGLAASRPQASALAAALGTELATHEEREFEDGEFKLRALESVRGQAAVVYLSLQSDLAGSSSDKLMRLLIFAGSLKDAGAAHVTAVVPYLAFARKDMRTKPRDPITTRYVAQIVEAVGIDSLITADVHNPAAFENAFRCEKRNLSAAALTVEQLAAGIEGSGKVVVLSPDAGAMKRARAFGDRLAERLGVSVPLAVMEKHRSEGRLTGDLFAGDVAGADVAVVDDMIAGGGTMQRAADAARARGARSVHAIATHGVFAEGAEVALGGDGLDSIIVTDTAGDVRARVPSLGDRLIVVESASLFADALGAD